MKSKFLKLRENVAAINRDLGESGLVLLTWGNASAVDRARGVMAIKPSGVDYKALRAADVVVVSLETGAVVAGTLRPSSDTPTHLELYRHFTGIGGVVHTHSVDATSWAQARSPLPCMGTTHADHFHGAVPVARELTRAEIAGAYEQNTGLAIVETFRRRKIDPSHMPAVLVPGHAPFVWGADARAALDNALALEGAARMAIQTLLIRPKATALAKHLLDRHFLRKHGGGAYYGQK